MKTAPRQTPSGEESTNARCTIANVVPQIMGIEQERDQALCVPLRTVLYVFRVIDGVVGFKLAYC